MNVAFPKLNASGYHVVNARDVVYVEDIAGGTMITTYDHKKLKVNESSAEILRILYRLLETGYEMGPRNALYARKHADGHGGSRSSE